MCFRLTDRRVTIGIASTYDTLGNTGRCRDGLLQCCLYAIKVTAFQTNHIHKSIHVNFIANDIFCVDAMYSGEYDACDVTLSVYPHRASLKNMPVHGVNRT